MAASSDQQRELEKEKARSSTSECPQSTTSAASQNEPAQVIGGATRPTLKFMLLGSEWNSSEGGLSTLNREFAIYLSKHPKVEVTLLVPQGACKDEEKREARDNGVSIVDAKAQPGYDDLDWLCCPPKDLNIDIVVGHGMKLGRQVQVILNSSEFKNCKWVQVVHTAPEDLSKYKDDNDPLSKGERKHQAEVDLCKLADLVIPVGPRLEELYSSYLRRCKEDKDVFSLTPGVFEREFGDLEQAVRDDADFKVLIFGRGDKEDFVLKGYNIAAKAFTDPRLQKKPYELIFVGAPKGKQKEVRERLLQCGIAREQLMVRTFIQSREKVKDLLCEVDLAIMPSKSEGFGLVALEALSAGLPILVGSKSGMAKALENVPNGHSCTMYTDDPTEWAKAIEAVHVRHRMRLKEIKALRASYGEIYSWKVQCEAFVERMMQLVYGPVTEDENEPRISSTAEQLPLAETSHIVHRSLEKDADFAMNQTEPSTSRNESQFHNLRKRKISESSCNPDIVTKHFYQDLSDEQEQIIHDILLRQIQVYTKYHKISTSEGVTALIEHIKKMHNLACESVGLGSVKITFRCPSLESLESLWRDYQSGHLNDIAEEFLVTDDIKKKLKLENVKLKTIIEVENYRMCKNALIIKSSLTSNCDFLPSAESDQEAKDSLQIDSSPDVSQQYSSWMFRAQNAKASRDGLHKAAITGNYENVKTLLDFGVEVDQRDQFSLTPLHLACWYGHTSVVKLLLERGANVNAVDKFQRTPLQKAERQKHHSIVKTLRNCNASPSFHQPVRCQIMSSLYMYFQNCSGHGSILYYAPLIYCR